MSKKTLPCLYGRAGDDVWIRRVLVDEIKRSGKSRAEIASQMSGRLRLKVTERMITAFTAQSKELHRWPAQFDIAFCEVVGSYRLLAQRVKRAGFRMIGPEEERLLQMGEAYRKLAKAKQSFLSIGGQL